MFATTAAALLAVAATAQAVINSPSSLVTCQPTLIQWTATTGPYYLTVINAGQPGSVLENLGTFDTNTLSYTWNVNLAAGTAVNLALKDSTGEELYTGSVTVTAGPDTSCVGKDLASSGTASASSLTTSLTASSVASTGASASSSASVTGSMSSSSAAASSMTSSTGVLASATSKASAIASSVTGGSSKVSSAVAAASSLVSGAGITSHASTGLVLAAFGVAGLYLA